MPFSTDRKHRRSPRSTPLLPQKHDDYVAEVGFDGASFSGAVFNLSTTIVGAGIMALPATLKQLGTIPGLIVIVLAAMLTESSIDMILRFSKAAKSTTYAGLVNDAFGGGARTLLQVGIIVNNVGMLVVYMIIIGDVLSGTWSDGVYHLGVMQEWFGPHWWNTRSVLMLLTTLLVFAPLISFKRVGEFPVILDVNFSLEPLICMATSFFWLGCELLITERPYWKDLSSDKENGTYSYITNSLRFTSALSVGLAVVFVVITAGVAVIKLINGSIGMPRLKPQIVDQASFWKLFTCVPILVTAYICHHNIHPIENELKDPAQMKSIVRTSITLCCSVYVATSFFGFLLFGDHTLDDILANFDGNLGIPYSSLLNDAVRVSYCIHLMLVFPIVFFSLRLNVDGLLFPYKIPLTFDNRRFFSVTSILMGFIFLGANFVPSIWDAFQFTGATATVSVGFIFPAAVALRDTHGIATKKDRLVSWVMLILAVSSSAMAISSDIYSIFNSERILES